MKILKVQLRAVKMAQWVNVLATNPDNLVLTLELTYEDSQKFPDLQLYFVV